ncbi:uncharacterized protein [Triticum aestivum]|uniref:uncharacterized protein n=1 Tax=Triticum aestivum TaxID=4565 RepID=UPI001D010E3D|nr:uncharacterized protein LOC123163090 [Triticum aestivum]
MAAKRKLVEGSEEGGERPEEGQGMWGDLHVHGAVGRQREDEYLDGDENQEDEPTHSTGIRDDTVRDRRTLQRPVAGRLGGCRHQRRVGRCPRSATDRACCFRRVAACQPQGPQCEGIALAVLRRPPSEISMSVAQLVQSRFKTGYSYGWGSPAMAIWSVLLQVINLFA